MLTFVMDIVMVMMMMTMVMVMMMTIDISIWSVVFVTQKREPFQTWLVSPTGSKNLQMSNIPKKIQRFPFIYSPFFNLVWRVLISPFLLRGNIRFNTQC